MFARFPRLSAAWLNALAILIALVAEANASPEAETGATHRLIEHLRTSPRLVGGPLGVRAGLEDRGVGLQLFFNNVTGAKVAGGIDSDSYLRNSGTYDFFLFADLEELLLAPNLEGFVHTKGGYGRNVNPFVGAVSDPIDDADFDSVVWVAQMWLQASLFDNRLRMRVGYEDQQTVFDRNAYANIEDIQFLSTALDNNPLVPLKIGLGATLMINPLPWWGIMVGTADADNTPRAAGFDTAFDGFSSLNGYLETTFAFAAESRRGNLPGTYRFGVFLDNTQRADVAAGDPTSLHRGHVGAYLSFDQLVLRESSRDAQGLGLFARYGYLDETVSRFPHLWSLGLQYTGAIAGRDLDALGFGMYQLLPSGRLADDIDEETGFELYYRIEVLPWLAITPDVQAILNPGAVDRTKDAVILALRVRMSL